MKVSFCAHFCSLHLKKKQTKINNNDNNYLYTKKNFTLLVLTKQAPTQQQVGVTVGAVTESTQSDLPIETLVGHLGNPPLR